MKKKVKKGTVAFLLFQKKNLVFVVYLSFISVLAKYLQKHAHTNYTRASARQLYYDFENFLYTSRKNKTLVCTNIRTEKWRMSMKRAKKGITI